MPSRYQSSNKAVRQAIGHLGEGKTSQAYRNPSLLRPVHKCKGVFAKMIVPCGWPIFTVAMICFNCGFVFDYIDDLDLLESFKKRTAGKERPLRPWVVRRGVAIPKEDIDLQEKRVLNRLRNHEWWADVARDENLPPDYVHALARLEHVAI